MIANISRQLTTGALAIAGSVAAFSFAGAAQASTLVIAGNATIDPWGTNGPVLTPTSVASVTPIGGGQFASASAAAIPNPFTLTGTGTGPFTVFGLPGPSPSFTTITTGPGPVTANVTPATATGTNSNLGSGVFLTTYTVGGTAIFIEPVGPALLGSFSIQFTRTDSPGSVVGVYSLTLTKTDVPAPVAVPEPSAILGILAVAGAGAFARRKS